MFRIFAIAVVLGLLASATHAQDANIEPRSSTIGEGWQRGAGAYLRGWSDWLEAKGRYENLHEEARGKHIDNWSNRIRTRWDIKDEYKARNHSETWPERRMRQLDLAEARYAVQQREDELRKKGVLPPKKESYFEYKGVKYNSCDDFKKSLGYQVMLAEVAAKRDREETLKEARYQEDVAFWAKYGRMSMSEQGYLLSRERIRKKAFEGR